MDKWTGAIRVTQQKTCNLIDNESNCQPNAAAAAGVIY